jgi:hypothetical protein
LPHAVIELACSYVLSSFLISFPLQLLSGSSAAGCSRRPASDEEKAYPSRCPEDTSEELEPGVQVQAHSSLISSDLSTNPLLGFESLQNKVSPRSAKSNMASPMSPRRRRAMERESMIEKVRHMVTSPFPYMVLILLVVMIVMIFVDVMPIAGDQH